MAKYDFTLKTKEGGNYRLRRITPSQFVFETPGYIDEIQFPSKPNFHYSNRYLKRIVSNNTRSKQITNKTAVIVPFFSIYENTYAIDAFNEFKEQIPKSDLFVIELSYFDLPFYIAESKNFIRLRGDRNNLMWQKERLINIALQHIPREYTNIAWIDGDILFENTKWKEDLHKKLVESSVVQLFETANTLEYDRKTINRSVISIVKSQYNIPNAHPGFAWAARREELGQVGLFDYHITGNGDSHMYGFFSGVYPDWHATVSLKLPGFEYYAKTYVRKLNEHLTSGVGYIPGHINHIYHGNYSNRNYNSRQELLMSNNYDPVSDIRINSAGLFEWNFDSESARNLYADIIAYFKARQTKD